MQERTFRIEEPCDAQVLLGEPEGALEVLVLLVCIHLRPLDEVGPV